MQNKWVKFIWLCFAIAVSFVFFSGCMQVGKAFLGINDTFIVILYESDGMEICGETSYEVSRGDRVVFEIAIDEDYLYLGNNAGAVYDAESGTLTLEKVRAPKTVEVRLIKKSELYYVNVSKNDASSTVTFLSGKDCMITPEEVTLAATPKNGYIFSGWSLGGYLENGGALISLDPLYSFTPTAKQTQIYANFELPVYVDYDILYNANGGTVAGTEDTSYIFHSTYVDVWAMQNTLHENSKLATFVREGYTAIGYSTEITTEYANYATVNAIGGFSNMGGVCFVPTYTGSLTLNVVWAKNTPASDFTVLSGQSYSDVLKQGSASIYANIKYETRTGCIITGYTGNDETVVIPETINGEAVIGIADGAFDGATNLKKLVVPKSVVRIESGAFSSCAALTEVVFFDSLQYVSDDSFPTTLKTVVLNSQRGPIGAYTAEGSFAIKYARIRNLYENNQKKLIVLAGSSTLFSLNSALLEKTLDGEYSVVNYGTNGGNQVLFFIEAFSKYLCEGDILTLAPEWTSIAPWGSETLVDRMFTANHQCYDIFREVDLSNYKKFWSAWETYQTGTTFYAASRYEREYQCDRNHMNQYGDRIGREIGRRGSWTTNLTLDPTRQLTQARADNLNRVNALVTAKKATLVLSFAPCDVMRVTNENWQELVDGYTAYCAQMLNFPVISNVGTYFMGAHDLDEGMDPALQEMYDSAWHCTYYGANIRTIELAYDIRQFLSNGGSSDSYENYLERESHKAESYPLTWGEEA